MFEYLDKKFKEESLKSFVEYMGSQEIVRSFSNKDSKTTIFLVGGLEGLCVILSPKDFLVGVSCSLKLSS